VPVINETTDATAGTGTSYSMTAGDYFFGNLSTGTESDWVEVSLVAGQTYTFAVMGTGALDDAANDTFLRLRNVAGTQIDFDDDDGPGRNSTITFTASSSGTYYLDVGSYIGTGLPSGDEGTYGLSMTLGSTASYDVTMGAGNLLRPSASWAPTSGTGAAVTWAIRTSGTEPGEGNPFIAPSAAQVAAIEDAMAYLSGVSGLTFSQINAGGTSNNATMLFGAYHSTTDGSGAYAYYPGSTASSANAGDVWLNNNSVSQTSLPLGSFSHFVMLHEIGHALGLAHPGDYNAAPGVSITYANNAQFIQDSHQYTVMSYFDESNTGVSGGLGYPDTMMLFDLLALHQQYGADMSYHAGATTYGFNATVSGAYDFTTNTTPFLCIWDGGGTDTIDLSGYSMAQLLTLEAGEFSNIGGYTGNMSIAIGAVIENAIGGSGNDTITGNSADNQITGGGGTDHFVMGIDRSAATITAIAGGYQVVSSLGTDQLFGVEFIQFNDQLFDLSTVSAGPTTGADALTGTASADVIDLLAGNDSYDGLGGNDTIRGSAGNDTLNGGDDHDTFQLWDSTAGELDVVNGQNGEDTADFSLFGAAVWADLDYGSTEVWTNDTTNARTGGGTWRTTTDLSGVENVVGTQHDDFISGDAGANNLSGGAGNDELHGDGGHDTLMGGAGSDVMLGGAGNDTFLFNTSVAGDLDFMDGAGGSGGDTADFSGFGAGIWVWLAYSGNSVWTKDTSEAIEVAGPWRAIANMVGIDHVTGTAYDDWIAGDSGGNILDGGGGNDRFVFHDGHGFDRINGFEATNDLEKIDLSAISAITDFNDLVNNHMSIQNGEVVIDTGTGQISLTGVSLSDLLDGNDFIFSV